MKSLKEFIQIINENYITARQEFSLDSNNPELTKNYIDRFKFHHNRLNGEDKDINAWRKKGWFSFKDFVDKLDNTRSNKQIKSAARKNSIKIFEKGAWIGLIPLSEEASCFYGKNTKWCTSAKNKKDNRFNQFFETFDLIYLINTENGERWAILVDRNNNIDIYDERDNYVPSSIFEEDTGLSLNEILSAYHKQRHS